MTNTPESIFCLVGLYYYNRLKPKFDRNMILMVVFISLSFIIRSSSLIGWVPLALLKAFQSLDYFLVILQAGVFIALPTIALSIFFDCLAYGRFTVPQINFVNVNVVENISKYFGTSPWYFYLQEFPEFIMSLDGMNTALLGFSILTIIQVNRGELPSFALFTVASFLVLTGIPHKEQRFMTAIFPLFIISWGYLWSKITNILPFVKKVFRIIFMIYVAKEI